MIANSSRFAIRFGESVDKGLEPQSCFPFIYTFIPSNLDTWERDKARDNLSGIGPTINPGATILHQVRLDADHNFLMLWIKFTAYHEEWPVYEWYEPNLAGVWFLEQGDFQSAIGTPLLRSILVSLSAYGPDNRTIYGGQAMGQLAANAYAGKVPVPTPALQGYDFGPGQLRTPYFLPANGMLMFELTNTHATKELTVGAAIYGLKVRI